jgi:hypothetical protein
MEEISSETFVSLDICLAEVENRIVEKLRDARWGWYEHLYRGNDPFHILQRQFVWDSYIGHLFDKPECFYSLTLPNTADFQIFTISGILERTI